MRRFSPAPWAGEIVPRFAAWSRLRLVASRLMARWRTAESSVWRFMDEILRCAPFLRQGRQDDGNGNDRGNYKSNDNPNGATAPTLPGAGRAGHPQLQMQKRQRIPRRMKQVPRYARDDNEKS